MSKSLDGWFAESLRPRLSAAVERGVVRKAQVDRLERHMADLTASRRSAARGDVTRPVTAR